MPRDDTVGYDRNLAGGNFPSSCPFGSGAMATWRMRLGAIYEVQGSSLCSSIPTRSMERDTQLQIIEKDDVRDGGNGEAVDNKTRVDWQARKQRSACLS